MPQTELSLGRRRAYHCPLTNLLSLVNTWRRFACRSQTYTRPSFDTSAQCTGLRNCCEGGASGLKLPRLASSGRLPDPPQQRFILPPAAPSTTTRLFLEPPAATAPLGFGSTKNFATRPKFSVSLRPLVL